MSQNVDVLRMPSLSLHSRLLLHPSFNLWSLYQCKVTCTYCERAVFLDLCTIKNAVLHVQKDPNFPFLPGYLANC
jgi:hypothetical protein